MLRPTKEDYDKAALWEAKYNLDYYKKEEINHFVLCETREENATRMFLHRFNSYSSAMTKEGWWDTFTITKETCKDKGLYLCKILDFKKDSNGFLNMVVHPVKYLGKTMHEDSLAWDYFTRTSLISSIYKDRKYIERFNVENLHDLFREDVDRIISEAKSYHRNSIEEVANFFFNKFLNGEISLEEIDSALDEKDDREKLVDDLTKNVRLYGANEKNPYYSKYPLLCKKLPKNEFGHYDSNITFSYLTRKNWEYDDLTLGNKEDFLERVEDVLIYWENKKEEKKRLKKEARKAKKMQQ